MKRIIYILSLGLFLACNSTTKKSSESDALTKVISEKSELDNSANTADYSTILGDYKCDMSEAEIAEVLNVHAANVILAKQDFNTKCYVDLDGYGNNSARLSWGTEPSSKKGNKKAITNYLKDKKNNEAVMGMDIVLSATKDCYLTYQPLHGRIVIYNENYENAFALTYGTINNKRTKEQHKELKNKMTDLANYLLEKHKK